MKKHSNLILTLVLIIAMAVLVGIAFAEPMEIPQGSRCTLCGMGVSPTSVYSAEIVMKDEMLPFCDIGDMLYYYNEQDEEPAEAYVRDADTGEWIEAAKAAYVHSDEFTTPMAWGIAAYSSRDEAAKHGMPMTFEEALEMTGSGDDMKDMKDMKGM